MGTSTKQSFSIIHFQLSIFISACGGIGRHARFRFWSARVQVQVLSGAPKQKPVTKVAGFLLCIIHSSVFSLQFSVLFDRFSK